MWRGRDWSLVTHTRLPPEDADKDCVPQEGCPEVRSRTTCIRAPRPNRRGANHTLDMVDLCSYSIYLDCNKTSNNQSMITLFQQLKVTCLREGAPSSNRQRCCITGGNPERSHSYLGGLGRNRREEWWSCYAARAQLP